MHSDEVQSHSMFLLQQLVRCQDIRPLCKGTKILTLTTGGKRGHTPITGNHNTFLTPAKPVSKKDKKHEAEYESEITSDTQGQITTPYMPFYNQAIPQPFTRSAPGQTGEEITSLTAMFRTIITKLNKLDNIETTIGDLSLSMEQLKTESAQVKTEVGLMKSEIKELKEKKTKP